MTSVTDLNKIGEVLSTDILIIGGGISGLMAAIKAKHAQPAVDVLVVDKATPGFAGQGPRVGGGNSFVKEGQFEEWFKWRVEIGGYLNDQDFTYAIGKDSLRVEREMAEWGAPWERDEKGKLYVFSRGLFSDGLWWSDGPAMMQFLKGKARSEGVRILKRVMMVELLAAVERVAGAVGFSIDSGQFYILKAKGTIIANGACMYQYRSHFKNNSGEGVAMAYNAGAEMRNAEFANNTCPIVKDNLWGAHGSFGLVENALGEDLCQKYDIGQNEPDKVTRNYTAMSRAMYKELQEGRGPMYMEARKLAAARQGTIREGTLKWVFIKVMERSGVSPDQKLETVIGQSARQGPIRVDPNCRTTLPGLWAVGDASYEGSGMDGANAPCSITSVHGVSLAEITGYRAGLDAAAIASETAVAEIHPAAVSRLKGRIYAPLQRKQGLDPNDVIYQVQEAIIPIRYNLFRSGDRMKEALSKVEEIKESLPTLWAKDLHYLAKAHEAASMALCAEMTYRPALMRLESRGCHMRDDYPEQDDQNWLKWIILKKAGREMKLWTEPVPIDKYRIKPPATQVKEAVHDRR